MYSVLEIEKCKKKFSAVLWVMCCAPRRSVLCRRIRLLLGHQHCYSCGVVPTSEPARVSRHAVLMGKPSFNVFMCSWKAPVRVHTPFLVHLFGQLTARCLSTLVAFANEIIMGRYLILYATQRHHRVAHQHVFPYTWPMDEFWQLIAHSVEKLFDTSIVIYENIHESPLNKSGNQRASDFFRFLNCYLNTMANYTRNWQAGEVGDWHSWTFDNNGH